MLYPGYNPGSTSSSVHRLNCGRFTLLTLWVGVATDRSRNSLKSDGLHIPTDCDLPTVFKASHHCGEDQRKVSASLSGVRRCEVVAMCYPQGVILSSARTDLSHGQSSLLEVGSSPRMIHFQEFFLNRGRFRQHRFIRSGAPMANMGGFSLILNATCADAQPVTSPDKCRVRTNPYGPPKPNPWFQLSTNQRRGGPINWGLPTN